MILFGLMLAGYAKGKGKDRILVSLKGLQGGELSLFMVEENVFKL